MNRLRSSWPGRQIVQARPSDGSTGFSVSDGTSELALVAEAVARLQPCWLIGRSPLGIERDGGRGDDIGIGRCETTRE